MHSEPYVRIHPSHRKQGAAMSRPRIRVIHYLATLVVSVVGIAAMAPVTNAGFNASQTGKAVITVVIPKDSAVERNEAPDFPIYQETKPAPSAPTASHEQEPAILVPTQEPEKTPPAPALPEQVVLEEPNPTEAPHHQAEESMTHEDPS